MAGAAGGGGASLESSAAELVRQNGAAWVSQLSPEEKRAVRAYTGTAYANINATLRGIEKSFGPGNYECARHIHQALSRASIPHDCTVYRGVSEKALGKLRFLPDKMLTGKIFSDKGFMSTSIEKGNSFGGDLLEISVPKGSHGAYVGHISEAGHYETEVLFDAGQVMRITGVRRDEWGRRIISVQLK